MNNKEYQDELIGLLRERGMEYTAQYIEKYGYENIYPMNFDGSLERVSKICIEKGKRWQSLFPNPSKDGFIH